MKINIIKKNIPVKNNEDLNERYKYLSSSRTQYDKDIINLYTQTRLYSNDFINVLDKTSPYIIDPGHNHNKFTHSVADQIKTYVHSEFTKIKK